MKKILLTLIEIIALYIRPYFLFKLFKLLKNTCIGNRLLILFDPNNLRKKYNHIFPQKLITFNAGNGIYQVDINDHIGYRFYMNNSFDSFLCWLGKRLNIKSSDILLDIGANIGTTCIPFACQFNNEIIAVEASKANCSLLLKNAFLNNIKMQCFCICAVDIETARNNNYIDFHINNGNMASSSIHNSWCSSVSMARIEHTKTKTIDEVIKFCSIDESKIKLIKIDVEGAEQIVLSGMKDLLHAQIPIVFEFRLDILEKYLNSDGSALINCFKDTHDIFGVYKDNNTYKLTPFNPKQSYEDVLAWPNQRNMEF